MKKGERCVCPHCGYEYEEPIEDFAIPGRIGIYSAAETDCDECQKWFTVEEVSPEEFTIRKGKIQ